MDTEYEIALKKGFEKKDLEDILFINNIKFGNKKDTTKLYNKYYNIIFYKTLEFSKGNIEMAEDMASEIFIKIFQTLEKYSVSSGSGKFGGWVNMVTKNYIIDKTRNKNFKERKNTLSIDKQFDSESGLYNPLQLKEANLNIEQELISKEKDSEKMQNLKCVLKTLNDEELKIINLRFYSNLSFDEIAIELNKTRNYCIVKFHRIKDKLKKKL
jgi:RNA polymerase sigma-70 factor (ECF subfamily)